MKDYFPDISETTICIIGMGYVGLPLTIEFSKINSSKKNSSNKFKRIIGFDIDEQRLKELKEGCDRTNEIKEIDLIQNKFIEFTSNQDLLNEANVFIVTVPTPINEYKKPDLKPLKKACEIIGKSLYERSKK